MSGSGKTTATNPASAASSARCSTRAGLRRPFRTAFWLAAGLLMGAGSSLLHSQTDGHAGISDLSAPLDNSGALSSHDPYDTVQTERRMRILNTERQKTLTADTEKLFKLATDLNAEIARTTPGELTPAQLRTVAEIEKLAHEIKEKMSMPSMSPPGNPLEIPPQFYRPDPMLR